MRYKREKVHISIKNMFQYALMFLIIISGQSLWMRINYDSSWAYNLTIIAACIIVVLIALEKKIYRDSCYQVVMIIGALILYMILNRSGQYLLFIRIMLPLCLLTIYLRILWVNNKIVMFVKKYADVVVVLAFISVVLYIFGTVLNLLPSQTVTYYWADSIKTCKTYYHLMYEAQNSVLFGKTFIRNCGIFCEAPSYAVPLILSLYFEWFIAERTNNKRELIIFAAVITSFSTKAFLLICIMVALKLFQRAYVAKKKGTNVRFYQFIVPVLIIIITCAVMIILAQKEGENLNSYSQRIDNLYSTMHAFKNNWLLGVGPGNEEAVSAYSTLILRRYGFSMGATLLLAEGGIYLTLLYVGSFINAMLKTKNKWIVICTGVVYLGILFTSNIIYFLSTIFILALGYSLPMRKK